MGDAMAEEAVREWISVLFEVLEAEGER